MTNLQKQSIAKAIHSEKERLGSYANVAVKCDVSKATISQMVNENWDLIKSEMWQKVAQALQLSSDNWQLANTINFRKVNKLCNDAKNYSLFQIISDKAGIGKSAPLKSYSEMNADSGVFYLRCREWAKREFLTELCGLLGINIGKSYLPIDQLGMKVCEFFYKRGNQKPQLIIDEADKLKDSALRWFIHLFNECEDQMSLILSGTPNLQQRILRGVKLKKQGFDELDSRFGRSFIGLVGATNNCVKLICEANGLLEREIHNQIFKNLQPTYKEIRTENGVQNIQVIDDLRRLKRMIVIEKIKNNL